MKYENHGVHGSTAHINDRRGVAATTACFIHRNPYAAAPTIADR